MHQKWDFIDSKSVINLINLSINNNFRGLYNVGSGTLVLKKIGSELKQCLLSNSKIIYGAIGTNDNDIKHLEADITKLKVKVFILQKDILKL